MSWWLLTLLPLVALLAHDLWRTQQRTRRYGGTIDLTGMRRKDAA